MTAPATWQIKIVGHDVWPASQFLANPKNYKLHPKAQGQATDGSLDDLGWIKSVTVNVRTGFVLDGHLRVTRALLRGEDTPVPVELVDLDESLEDEALLVLDELARQGMQALDVPKVDELLRRVQSDNSAIQQLLDTVATNAGIVPPHKIDHSELWQGMPDFEQDNLLAWKTLFVHFRNEQDLREFAELLNQSISIKTKFIWFPVDERLQAGRVEQSNEHEP